MAVPLAVNYREYLMNEKEKEKIFQDLCTQQQKGPE